MAYNKYKIEAIKLLKYFFADIHCKKFSSNKISSDIWRAASCQSVLAQWSFSGVL